MLSADSEGDEMNVNWRHPVESWNPSALVRKIKKIKKKRTRYSKKAYVTGTTYHKKMKSIPGQDGIYTGWYKSGPSRIMDLDWAKKIFNNNNNIIETK